MEGVDPLKGPWRYLIKAAGGDAVMQITADIFGLEAQRPHTFETSGLGAAINAAVGSGHYKNHRQAITAMTHPGQRFSPQEHNKTLYDRLFNEVYTNMYDRLKPLYSAIRRIVGYP